MLRAVAASHNVSGKIVPGKSYLRREILAEVIMMMIDSVNTDAF